MVSIKKAKQGFSLRQRGRYNNPKHVEQVGLLVGGLCVGFFIIVVWQSMGTDKEVTQQKLATLRHEKPHPHLVEQASQHAMGDRFNAVALDILETLDCATLLDKKKYEQQQQQQNNNFGMMDDWGAAENNYNNNENPDDDDPTNASRRRRRRLDDQHGDDGGFRANAGGGGEPPDDDDKPLPDTEEQWNAAGGGGGDDNWNQGGNNGGWDDAQAGGGGWDGSTYMDVNAQHLFCLAASEESHPDIQSEFQCDASGSKRKALLDLWSSARAQLMNVDLLKKILQLGKEHANQVLLEKTYHLWAPAGDEGMTYMLGSLNSENVGANGGILNLQKSLGPNKYFVDVGSCLGLTSLAIHDKYPGTTVISMEPAFPNWLYQELNVRCNLQEEHYQRHYKLLMSGVGPNNEDEDYLMAKLMWRPTATTSTRAWTPSSEYQQDQDVEFVVRLQRLKQILAEAGLYDIHKVNVLNVDCEGCEYNLIPALSEEEFDAIPVVLGNVHWGYIPTNKLPSSARGHQTHGRLCAHETIAIHTKECCAFMDLPVKSNVPGEVLKRDHHDNKQHLQDSTVKDIIQEGLCDDFDQWSKDHFLNDVLNDWGWMELSSQA